MIKYWIGVVSKDHAMMGVDKGVAQIGHGKLAPLKKMHEGDWLIYYSPNTSYTSKDSLQAFTAIGKIEDEEIYREEMNPKFNPFRRRVKYFSCKETPVHPLIDKLSFIKNKESWGYTFRFGLVEIPKEDFEIIARAMGIKNNTWWEKETSES